MAKGPLHPDIAERERVIGRTASQIAEEEGDVGGPTTTRTLSGEEAGDEPTTSKTGTKRQQQRSSKAKREGANTEVAQKRDNSKPDAEQDPAVANVETDGRTTSNPNANATLGRTAEDVRDPRHLRVDADERREAKAKEEGSGKKS